MSWFWGLQYLNFVLIPVGSKAHHGNQSLADCLNFKEALYKENEIQRKLDRVGQHSKGAKYKKLLIGITNQI